MYKYFLFTVNVNIKTGVLSANKTLLRLLVLLQANDLFDGAGG